jgi:hypothetical protein
MAIHQRTAAANIRAVATALCALGAIGTAAPAFAQTTPGTAGLGELFTGPESVELKDGAAEKLLEAAAGAINPREPCPQQTNFKVIVKRGDLLFQQALAAARRDALIAELNKQNFPDSRYEFTYDWQGNANDVQVSHGRMRDRQRPNLHTTSVPPKGRKVKPGDRITVTMVARDDANRVQSGIQRIQLVARAAGGDEPVGSQDYPLVRRPNCEGMPEARTLVLTYTVPRNPPPVIRLVAVTEDHVGLSDHHTGEFPIGDWYGTLTWKHRVERRDGWAETTASADVKLDYDSSGGLTGTMIGRHSSTSGPRCAVTTVGPGTINAELVGSYTPGRDAMAVRVSEKRTTPTRMVSACGGPEIVRAQPAAYEIYERAFRGLTRNPDGSFTSIDDQTVSGAGEAGSVMTTVSHQLTLRPASN